MAAQISRDGHPVECFPASTILSPLPLSSNINLPVTIFGCFLVCHNGGRYLLKYQDKDASVDAWNDAGNQLIEVWNRELMSCVLDSYTEMVMEIQKLRREPLSSSIEPSTAQSLNFTLKVYGDRVYSFWPRSALTSQPSNGSGLLSKQAVGADWKCIVDHLIRPFYTRAVELPLWQLYTGNVVKASEGMFLSQPENGVSDNVLPSTVCAFVKEQYPVFSVPWELVTEVQAVGVSVQEIKPQMVRELLRLRSTSIVLRSVSTYLDVLEYCLSDIRFSELINSTEDSPPNQSFNSVSVPRSANILGTSNFSVPVPNMWSSHLPSSHSPAGAGSGDALEMVTTLGKALFDFGRGVVEDIGRTGESIQNNNVATSSNSSQVWLLPVVEELKGIPCPTATKHLTRLGYNEIWLGSREQQELMIPLAAKFIHPEALERPVLLEIFSNPTFQSLLRLKSFSLPLLSSHMKLIFHENWVAHVLGTNLSPWFSWGSIHTLGSEGGPSPEWIRLFWKYFSCCGSLSDLLLFNDWPLIPAFLGRPVLCRVRERHFIFIPPALTDPNTMEASSSNDQSVGSFSIDPYLAAFEKTRQSFPWLLSLLNQCNIPTFDTEFINCAASCGCIPSPGQSLGQIIASKLVAARKAGYFPQLTSFSASDKDELLRLFAEDFLSNGSEYGTEELEVLRTLPIYKTVIGTYTVLHSQGQCMISSNSFLKPYDEHCLSCTADSVEGRLVNSLGIPEMHDQQILVRFGLPGYDGKPQSEQEDILIYLLINWQQLQVESSVIEALKETKFVKSADEFCTDLFKPKDLFDPNDALLSSVFSGERRKFPGERFTADGWLRILRKTGLRTASEADVILECAKKVELIGAECMKPAGDLDDFGMDLANSHNEIPNEIYSLAGSVVDVIFANFAVLYSNNFCNVLGETACVPAELGLPNIGGKKGGKRVLTSYNDAIVLKDWPLAWSSAPILSRQNVVPPEYSWGSLHLRSPPAFSKVLKHLQVT